MPSKKRKTVCRHDGAGDEMIPSELTQYDPTIENQIIPKKFRSFITSTLQRDDITAFDQQNLKFSLSADNKKMLSEAMIRLPTPFFTSKEEAYLFFDYKEEPKIIKKIKEKINDPSQQDILKNLKSIIQSSSSSSSSATTTTTTTAATPKKQKQILAPSNIKLAISIKDISKNVDTTNEQSIQQKIMQYTDLLTVLDEDEKQFPNYFTLLSEEIQKSDSKFNALQKFLGNNLNELKENIQKEIISLFTQQGIINRFNTIKDYNLYLSETIEPKIVKEENKLKLKQEQAAILQSDLVIFLFKLNDSLQKILKNDFIKLYDALLQIKKIDYFGSLFDKSPLEIIDFSPVKFDNIPSIDIESHLSDSEKSKIIQQLNDIQTKSDSQKSRLAFVTDTNAKIDEEFIKVYGYLYDTGVKLLNQMIQQSKKASKQTSAYVVDDYIAKSKKPKVKTASSLAVVAYEPPVAVAPEPVVASVAASEPILPDSEPPVFQPLASSSESTPSPLPFLQQIGNTTLKKSPQKPPAKLSVFDQMKQGIQKGVQNLKKTSPQQEKPTPKATNAFQTALLNNPKFKSLGNQRMFTDAENEGWLDGKRSTKKKSRQPTKKLNKKSCRNKVQEKIIINLHEFKNNNKKFRSKKQALAVSYSQVRSKFPECIKYLLKKNL
jgi:hypothetical protein